MSFPFFDAPTREPSQFVGFAGNRIDRQSEHRTEQSLPDALADPTTRILLSRGGRLHLKYDGTTFEPYLKRPEAEALGARMADAILLGRSQVGPVVMAPAALEPDDLPDGMKAIDHRSLYVQGLLAEETLGELAQGASLLQWHRSCLHCGRCGTRTTMRAGGYKRHCAACDVEHFPRTDPVAIMLAISGERCLLGRSPRFGPGMYSALAGFIEPGETIEAAVRRETMEEAGIRLGRVVYHASQPWPFPHSLMIGCFGEALNEDISFDGDELEDCRWFTRREVQAILAGQHEGGVTCPPAGAIAHHLVSAWAKAA